jgi:mRNA interferase RelE/StbE
VGISPRGRYGVVVDPAVIQELSDPKRYPAKVQLQLLRRILSLSVDPRPQDSKKLEHSIYRVTSGEYRVVYEVDDAARRITIFLVGKRGDDEIYRRFARY